jgi:hypothetical protein
MNVAPLGALGLLAACAAEDLPTDAGWLSGVCATAEKLIRAAAMTAINTLVISISWVRLAIQPRANAYSDRLHHKVA